MKPAIFEEVENQLIGALADGTLDGASTVDMHHIVYNQSETYVYYEDAKRDLEQIGTSLACQEVLRYEQDDFGQTSSFENYGNPCWVANMLIYILGEALINHIFGDDPDYQEGNAITPELAVKYAKMVDDAFDADPDLVARLWQNL